MMCYNFELYFAIKYICANGEALKRTGRIPVNTVGPAHTVQRVLDDCRLIIRNAAKGARTRYYVKGFRMHSA